MASFTLNAGQRIIFDRSHRTLIYQGGRGAGKSTCGPHFFFTRLGEARPGALFGAVAPTARSVKRNIVDAIIREGRRVGIPVRYRVSAQEVDIAHVTVQLSSADKPESLAGPTWSGVWVDEPADITKDAFSEIDGRLRGMDLPSQQVIMTGTPRGRRTHLQSLMDLASKWDPKDGPCPILACITPTWVNAANLPPGYVEYQRSVTFKNDPAGFTNFMLGVAENRRGRIYTNFNTGLWPTGHVRPFSGNPIGQLIIGQDFNIHWQVTVVGLLDQTRRSIHVIREVVSRSEGGTEAAEHMRRVAKVLIDARMAARAQDGRLMGANGHQVWAFIDASGNNGAGTTDAMGVRNAGFLIKSGSGNGRVDDRIATVQHAFGANALFIDPSCKGLIQALEEHGYDKWGEDPQKRFAEGEHQCDHYNDALGYMVVPNIPIRRFSW